MAYHFPESDLQQIGSLGIDIKTIERQIDNFIRGFPYVKLIAPATLGNGIYAFSDTGIHEYIDYYHSHSYGRKLIKFVPASGAASRMFKHLFEYIEGCQGNDSDYEKFIMDKSFHSVYKFVNHIDRFAFYTDLERSMNVHHGSINKALENHDFCSVIRHLLYSDGLGYASLPKGLLKFHRYPEGARTPFEEHLIEGVKYCKNSDGKVSVHFTVSPEHLDIFNAQAHAVMENYEKKFSVRFNIEFSLQKSSTDTIAVDLSNEPFRESGGKLFFRPAGHGALLENLNDLRGDIIFIKNIDNVVTEELLNETIKYKKALGGYLLLLQDTIHMFIRKLELPGINDEEVQKIDDFCKKELMLDCSDQLAGLSKKERISCLYKLLDRPIRICGMVKNQGEPGGGPFWVKNDKGAISLQIIESSQVDRDDPEQVGILKRSTHFNPVDLVCGVRNHKREPFDLTKYTDPSTGFISIKSKDGRDIKAQELPGLWNGAMADWITLFVEVPVITFNPVKTINDLLRDEHQGIMPEISS